MSRPRPRVLVLVRPYLLGSALVHALDDCERDVIAIDCDHGEIPLGHFAVVITTERLPSGIEADAVIELPPANTRSFGAIHHGNTTRLLALDDPSTVSDALTQLVAAG